MDRIGERIKKKREQQGLHLNELAEKVEISPSGLSQIENSRSLPSISTLKSIADALHTTIGELTGENESMTNNPVVLKTEIKYKDKNNTGTIIFLLSNYGSNKQMDTYMVRFSKGSGIDGLFKSRNGQVFCHVISGEIRFDLNNTSYFLTQGDNIYFNARMSYNAINNNDGLSEMLWIQAPPVY